MTIAFPGYVPDVVGGGSPGRVTAEWGNAVRDRLNHVFATTADRDAAITSPKEGQEAYVTATHTLYIYDGTAWRAYDVRAQSWAPTVTQSGTVTKTDTYTKYWRRGNLCTASARLDITGSGTANNIITVTLPVTGATTGVMPLGTGWIRSAGVTYPALVEAASQTTVEFVDAASAVNVYLGQTGASFGSALSNGVIVGFSVEYEIA